mgnify:CR=1 FL=1
MCWRLSVVLSAPEDRAGLGGPRHAATTPPARPHLPGGFSTSAPCDYPGLLEPPERR